MLNTKTINVGYFIIGFLSWLLLSNIVLVICIGIWIVVKPAWTYIIPLGLGCVWLSTIVSIMLLAKKHVWLNTGVVTAVIVSIGVGLLLAHGLDNLSKVFVVLTPMPLDYLMFIYFIMS
jgi:hypothetical protein